MKSFIFTAVASLALIANNANASDLAPKRIQEVVESMNAHCPEGYQLSVSLYERPLIEVKHFDPVIMAIDSTTNRRMECGTNELSIDDTHCMAVECTQPIIEPEQ